MSKIKKAVEPKVMAPNDPNRIPLAHRKLVNELFEILDENSYNIYDAQVITQTLSILARGKDMSKNMTTLVQLVEAVTKVENGERDIEAILQILGGKMTESLNKLSLSNINFENISEE